MPKFYETAEFKKLNQDWTKKLEKEGFEDIEPVEGRLRKRAEDFGYSHKHAIVAEAKAEYYRRAGQFLFEHRFPDKTTRRIWELHSKGIPVREIARRLKRSKKAHEKTTVHTIITELTAIMKKKYWDDDTTD